MRRPIVSPCDALHRERLVPVDVAEVLDGARRGDACGDRGLEHLELLLERQRVAVDHADARAAHEQLACRRRGRPPRPPSTRRPRAGAPTRSGRASPRAPLSLRQFGNGTQRGGIPRRDEQRRRARLAPGGQPLGDPLLRPDERDLVDERVRHRGDRVALLARRGRDPGSSAPRPRSRSARRARCRSSCRARPCRRCTARSTASARRAPPARRRAAPPGRSARCRSRRARTLIGKISRARSGEKKSGIQPSAISNASSTAFGHIDAR